MLADGKLWNEFKMYLCYLSIYMYIYYYLSCMIYETVITEIHSSGVLNYECCDNFHPNV